MDIKRLVKELPDSRKAKLLEQIRDRQAVCNLIGKRYDEKAYHQVEEELRKTLGVF